MGSVAGLCWRVCVLLVGSSRRGMLRKVAGLKEGLERVGSVLMRCLPFLVCG